MIPRPWQSRAIEEIRQRYREHARRVVLVAPTGAGKSYVFAAVTAGAAAKGKRVVIAAHRVEICDQISAALDGMGVAHGRIAADRAQTREPIQVAMVQTLARRFTRVAEPDLFVIDECHHVVGRTYETIVGAWPNARVLGVTATPQRLDGRGLGEIFETMVIGPTVHELTEGGYLAPYQYLAPATTLDLRGVKTVAGDYARGELADALDRPSITGDAVAHFRKYLAPRSAIAFCVTVAHAGHVAAEFRAAGFAALSVDGSMAPHIRRERIAMIGDGRLDVLTSCAIISEGLDVPSVGGAILLRPTKSLALHLQQIGRCLRPKPDGSAAVILDHVGNVFAHGMPDADREWTLDGRKRGEAPPKTRRCDTCFRVFGATPGCERGDCPFRAAHGAADELATPEVRDGELAVVDAIAVAREQERRRREVAMAETVEELEKIRKARGYRPGWSYHVRQARERARARRSA